MGVRIYGNRLVKTLPGQDTRPTTARVREAIFNIWQGSTQNCRWLDLCAGSGSMGAEALCRGASCVVGIERSPRACSLIRQNWQSLARPEQTWRVIQGDVVNQLPLLASQTFDLIYADPPYTSGLYLVILDGISQHNLLVGSGEIALEHDPALELPEVVADLEIYRQKRYGSTALTFYRRCASVSANSEPVSIASIPEQA